MPLLKHLEPNEDQAEAVRTLRLCCRALKDATLVHETQVAKGEVWRRWEEAAAAVRDVGLDPLLYSDIS